MGGSSGGGGSVSGTTDFPAYMKAAHANWLMGGLYTATSVTDSMTYSVVDLMNLGMAANPYGTSASDLPFPEGAIPATGFSEYVFFANGQGATGGNITNYRGPYEYLKCLDKYDIGTEYSTYVAALDTRKGTQRTAFDTAYNTTAVADLISKISTYLTAFNTQYDGYKTAIGTDVTARVTALDGKYVTYIADIISKIGTYLTSFNTQYDGYKTGYNTDFDSFITSLNTAYTSYITDDTSKITAAVTAESSLLDAEVTSNVTKYQAGMADINATMSSAFTIGAAIFTDSKTKMVAKFDADARLIRLKDSVDAAIRRLEIQYKVADEHIKDRHLYQLQRAQTELESAIRKLLAGHDGAIAKVQAEYNSADKFVDVQHGIQLQRASMEIEAAIKKMTASQQMALEGVRIRDASVLSEQQLETQFAMNRINQILEWRRIVTLASGEFSRLYGAMRQEVTTTNVDVAAKRDLWDLEIYQYGSNVMSGISGSVSKGFNPTKGSALGGAIGGALAGAGMGASAAMAMGPAGAAAAPYMIAGGAIMGLAASL